MIHGLQNDNAGAVAKAIIAKNKLRRLGYTFILLLVIAMIQTQLELI